MSKDDDAPHAEQQASPVIPPVRGDRFIRVLIAFGWLPVEWNERTCTLASGGCSLVVPRHALLEPDVLATLLEAGAVTPLQFVIALERVCAQDLAELRISREPEKR